MSELDSKAKHKPIKHKVIHKFGWPSTAYFEFITTYGLDTCVLMIWQHKRLTNKRWSFFSYKYSTVQVQQPLPDIAYFTIRITDIQRRSISTLFQGTLEALNDGSTAVRGNIITASPLPGLALLLGLTALWMLMLWGQIQTGGEMIILLLLVPGLVMIPIYLVFTRARQHMNLVSIRKLLNS